MFISVEAVRWAFTQSQSERSARLVLLAIATHCNDDGYCWPGLEAIMRYCRLSKPIVLKGIEELIGLKELTVEKGGRGAGDTNYYYLAAFMQGRVNKGKEIENKGKVAPQIRVNTGIPEQEVLEETIEERHRPINFAEEAIRESHRTGEEADVVLKRLRAAK